MTGRERIVRAKGRASFNEHRIAYRFNGTLQDVTEQAAARKKIEEREEMLRLLINESPIRITFLSGPEMKVVLANETVLKSWNRGPSVIGKPLREILPELENQHILEILDDIYKTGKTYTAKDAEVRFEVDGESVYHYFDLWYIPLLDEQNKPYGILANAVDVTEKVLAQKKITASDQRFRLMIQGAPVAMGLTRGPKMVFENFNTPMLRLINRTPNILGKELLQVLPELEQQPVLGILKKVYETREPFLGNEIPSSLEVDGALRERYFNISYTVLDESPEVLILHVATDVTEQVLARQKIEEAQQKARLAMESADLGAYDINLLTNEMKASDRFNQIWGADASMPRAAYADFIHPEDRETRARAHQEALKTGNLHYETRLIWRDGSIHWARIKGKVLYDDSHKPVTLIGVIQDITEQKEFAEQLTKQVRERTQELHRSNDDLLHFAHVASHDLKEPTRKIKFFSNMLEEQFKDQLSEKGVFYLNKIQNATDRMFSMIEGVLTYSALRAAEQPIQTVSLNEIVDHIEKDLEVAILQKNATFTRENLPVIEGASILIYQLFYNLANNALKFSSPDRAPVIRISTAAEANGNSGMATIVFSDNGIGIEPDYLEQIFDPFIRLHAKDQYEGTGLGLALCKKIVERHHGSISATGLKGEGAAFTIRLPLKQTEKIL